MESKYLPDPEQFRPLTPVAYVLFGLLFLSPLAKEVQRHNHGYK